MKHFQLKTHIESIEMNESLYSERMMEYSC